MSGHSPRDLFLHGPVPLEARKVWAWLPKLGAVLGSASGLWCLWAKLALSRWKTSPAASKGRFVSTLAGCTRKPRTVLLSP